MKQAALLCLLAVAGCRPEPRNLGTLAPQSVNSRPLGVGRVVRRVRRLSQREYNNVVGDLLGDTSRPADGFLPDSYPNGYDNGPALLSVGSDQASELMNAAEKLAATAVTQQMPMLLGGCDPSVDGEVTCARVFLESFTARAFRRKPTPAELQRLTSVYLVGWQAGGFTVGIRTALEAILQSPAFLYREEIGDLPAPDGSGQVVLTPSELASELSFFLTGSMPDADLQAAVEQGRLSTDDDIRREARRLLQTDAARQNIHAFVRQWLATDRLSSLTKDPAVFPAFTPALATSMANELDAFVDDVVWAQGGSLHTLLTSKASFADATLAPLYARADGELARQGILTRAGYLAAHASPTDSAPVQRGVFFRENLLCAHMPPPPPGVIQAAMAQPVDPNATTRERYATHSSDRFCQACHALLDPPGFAFEEFDSLGIYRTTEKGQPIDSSAVIIGTEDMDGTYTGGWELVDQLSNSRQFSNCFNSQLYRFAMGDTDETANVWWVHELAGGFSTEQSVNELLVSYAASPLFRQRAWEGQ